MIGCVSHTVSDPEDLRVPYSLSESMTRTRAGIR
jgi:hypothetical protein